MRVVYWTTACLEPEIEAISKEVFQLARHFSHSLVFGVNPHYRLHTSLKQKAIGFHPKFDPFLRLLIPCVELSGDINHVYSDPTPWVFYKTLHRKPLVLTIAAEQGCPQVDFLERCRKIWVQTDTFQSTLLNLGIAPHKVEVLYPAVDLAAFQPQHPTPPIGGPSKVVFATAPRSSEEMAPRGVYLLLEAARACADIHYRLLYRPWPSGYTSLATTAQWLAEAQLPNVTLTNSAVKDMTAVYNTHHFTIIPYTQADGGKACPTSMVEGMACGLPVLISSVSPFAYFVEQHQCGVVFEPTPQALVTAVETGLRRYQELSTNATETAQHYFSAALMFRKVGRVYEDIMALS